MVAPTRTPQARGVKCDLCKKILSSATWLDQTKLAKKVDEARAVLNLITEHETSDCPCIPKNIGNLLVGSTHFEIHRLLFKELDVQVHKKQFDLHQEARHWITDRSPAIINDCYDTKKGSRFRIYPSCFEAKQCEKTDSQMSHLKTAIDFWTTAMEDQANPFNTKLALRLGLTHHVVYACYLFKFYKILDFQLKTSVLMLNIFKSIDGVTANAILHANYLLIRSLIDCSQIDLARQYLKKATKITNYQEKSFYESILLNCVDCELKLMDEAENDKSSILDELAELVTIRKDDKLQHYYARTLAMSTIIKNIQHFQSKSDNCFEYFHTFRFICAIIRRCYGTSFDLVLSEKESSRRQTQITSNMENNSTKQYQILDHNWIRFAVCDFSFATFNILANFFKRAGMPECLELLFNGLSLVAFRSGSVYWQSRIVSIGVEFDILCDKLDDAKSKLGVISKIGNHSNDPIITNLLRLECEVSSISLIASQGTSVIKKEMVMNLLERIKAYQQLMMNKVKQVSIYDCKSGSSNEINSDQQSICDSNQLLALDNSLLSTLGLNLLKFGISSLLDVDIASPDAKYLMKKTCDQITSSERINLEFYNYQLLLEIMIMFTNISDSEQQLLQSVNASNYFLKNYHDLSSLQEHLSTLTLNNDSGKANTRGKKERKQASDKSKNVSTKIPRLPWTGRSSRKDTYEVAIKTEENLPTGEQTFSRICDPVELLKLFSSLSKEEILLAYLKHSDPNPDYLLYRRAHEMLLSLSLSEADLLNQDQILFHFTESCSSNTMRYRWMMYEEQQVSPYDSTANRTVTNGESICPRKKFLTFCCPNVEKVVKSMTSRIPDDFRLYQFKYIIEVGSDLEHLLIMCIDSTNDLVCIQTKRAITTDDFFEDAKNREKVAPTIPKSFEAKIEESRKSLLASSKVRSGTRQKLESEFAVILHDLENEWLGPYRFILCAKIVDSRFNNMISGLIKDIDKLMTSEHLVCNSTLALRMLLEGAALLTREEFCSVISALYSCSRHSELTRVCFNQWLKTLERYIKEHEPNMNKTLLLKKLPKGQIGLILDQRLEHIPFESLPAVRFIDQGMFRVPSLRVFNLIISRRCLPIKVDSERVAYVLDPANNLAKTRERFDQKLKANKCWVGSVGVAPKIGQLDSWLTEKELYIFIGHGAGTTYYNKLCKGKGLSAMAHIQSAAIVMGCSSGRMLAEGPKLESFGIGWVFILRGAPCYLGLLWDVTDTDIDKYMDSLMSRWMPANWTAPDLSIFHDSSCREQIGGDLAQTGSCITDASAMSRQVCQLKFLVGSTPVVYGIPIYCRN